MGALSLRRYNVFSLFPKGKSVNAHGIAKNQFLAQHLKKCFKTKVLMIPLWISHRYWTKKMVIWKEHEHELNDSQKSNDPMTKMTNETPEMVFFIDLVSKV